MGLFWTEQVLFEITINLYVNSDNLIASCGLILPTWAGKKANLRFSFIFFGFLVPIAIRMNSSLPFRGV